MTRESSFKIVLAVALLLIAGAILVVGAKIVKDSSEEKQAIGDGVGLAEGSEHGSADGSELSQEAMNALDGEARSSFELQRSLDSASNESDE